MLSPIAHFSLNATLQGVESTVDGFDVVQYKGIQFATIPARFAQAKPIDDWKGSNIDCTRYGPRCPQVEIDIGYLLRLPEDVLFEKEEEDEFRCLNLHLSGPATSKHDYRKRLPVLFWIHGGSQVVTFASAASGVCDTRKIVADSLALNQPIIVVSVNYRLNIFAFGDGRGECNLALKDQALGLQWVRKHISGFGGDPDNITVAGESAGAVYAHAHMFLEPPVRRGILSSGSLYLSPPLPREKGRAFVDAMISRLGLASVEALRTVHVEALLNDMSQNNVTSLWLQEEVALEKWQSREENVEALMIGDVEYETIIWRNGIEDLSSEAIIAAFDAHLSLEDSKAIRHAYGISSTRPTSCKTGALDFINDVKFAIPVDDIASRYRASQKPVYQYLIDQCNPFQSSARAHHAVDLLFLFGGVDMSFDKVAEKVGAEMRKRWIMFVNGEKPWDSERRFAIGPHGLMGEIGEEQFATRRRVRHFNLLRKVGLENTARVVGQLAAGRVSLHN